MNTKTNYIAELDINQRYFASALLIEDSKTLARILDAMHNIPDNYRVNDLKLAMIAAMRTIRDRKKSFKNHDVLCTVHDPESGECNCDQD